MVAKAGKISEYPKDLDTLELVCVNCGTIITADDIDKCPHCSREPYVGVVEGLRI